MGKTTTDLQQIVASGGGVHISAKGKTSSDLQKIVFASKQSGATVIIDDVSTKTTTDLKRIASAAPGNVIFDLRNQKSMCPIPDFDHNNVLPPHEGDPADRSQLSPYPCTILELCHKFSTSPQRIEILKGLIAFRQRMHANGVIFGFQWLDGSFMEDIELMESRAPRDLDILTFYRNLSVQEQADLRVNFPEFSNHSLSKSVYKLDHYPIDYAFRPEYTVEATRYWLQLFTHNRNGVWKGMLRLALNTPVDDQHALDYLNSL